jgi:hypothetical protein
MVENNVFYAVRTNTPARSCELQETKKGEAIMGEWVWIEL